MNARRDISFEFHSQSNICLLSLDSFHSTRLDNIMNALSVSVFMKSICFFFREKITLDEFLPFLPFFLVSARDAEDVFDNFMNK